MHFSASRFVLLEGDVNTGANMLVSGNQDEAGCVTQHNPPGCVVHVGNLRRVYL